MKSRTRPSSNYIIPGDFPDSRPGATPVGLRGRWRRALTCACPRAPQGNPTSAVSLAETFAGKLHPDQYTCARARLSRLCDPRTRGAKCFDLRDFRRGTSVPPSSVPLSLNVSLSLPPPLPYLFAPTPTPRALQDPLSPSATALSPFSSPTRLSPPVSVFLSPTTPRSRTYSSAIVGVRFNERDGYFSSVFIREMRRSNSKQPHGKRETKKNTTSHVLIQRLKPITMT